MAIPAEALAVRHEPAIVEADRNGGARVDANPGGCPLRPLVAMAQRLGPAAA